MKSGGPAHAGERGKRCQEVETGSEAEFGDGESLTPLKTLRQAVAFQEDVAGLFHAPGPGKIGVVKTPGQRHLALQPFQVRCT